MMVIPLILSVLLILCAAVLWVLYAAGGGRVRALTDEDKQWQSRNRKLLLLAVVFVVFVIYVVKRFI